MSSPPLNHLEIYKLFLFGKTLKKASTNPDLVYGPLFAKLHFRLNTIFKIDIDSIQIFNKMHIYLKL